jgi:xylulokinase
VSLLGIDVGTTGCKAAAYAVDGALLAESYHEYDAIRPEPDRAELDSRHVWQCVRETIAQVVAACRADPVSALCASSMGEAMTPVTLDREIVGNCILSQDTRGGDYVRELADRISQEQFYRINPNILGPNYSLPKLRWTMEHDPATHRRAERYLLWADLVGFLLGGDPVTSYSLANRTLLFDITAQDWSDRIIALSGVDRSILADTVPSGTIAGEVAREPAADLGLPAGARIVVGGHDQSCNALGAGACSPGQSACGIGSFECITPVYDHIPQDVPAMLANGLNVEHHVLSGLYVSFLYNQAGLLVKWFRDTFAAGETGATKPADLYAVLNSEMPPEPTRLVVLPYFTMTGPPQFVTDAAGVVAGLKTTTTRGEILKAIMEGVTFYFIEGISALSRMGIDVSRFVATGGGARSDRWLQIKADILGVPFTRPRTTECTAMGAAILAGLGTGEFASVTEALDQFVAYDRTFEPDPERHREYQELYGKYRALYPLLQDYLRTI